jgi:hypothetical protein
LRKELAELLISTENTSAFKNINFDKKTGTIYVDKRKIVIPYASNQYYLCKAVFLNPNKNWEVDELLEKFGEEAMSGATRKIYDAMLAVNKKTGIKLVVHKNKTFKFNQDYIQKLSKGTSKV